MGIRVGGLASGLDTNALVESLLTLERRPLELAEQRRAVLELEQSLFRDLNTLVKDLRTAATSIDNRSTGLTGASIEEEFLAYSATSSDETVASVTAGSGATPGTVDVRVDAMPTASREVTTAFASDVTTIATAGETLTIDAGGAAPISITVQNGGATLADLRAAINTDVNNGGEVSAAVIDDGTGFRLVISGTQTGAANAVNVTTTISNGGSPFIDTALSQVATDAQLNVFGIDVTRASATIDDLIPGVTLTLRSASATPIQVNVELDETAITEKLQTFADAYNAILDFVSEQAELDPASELAGPLSGDSTLRSIENTLQRNVISRISIAGNPFSSLSQIGLSLDDDGRLALDEAVVASALAQDAKGVRQFFSGDGVTDGIALSLARAIDDLTEGDDVDPRFVGIFQGKENGYQQQIDSADRQIERLELRLERREELLVLQFSQLETLLASLQQQGSALDSLQQPFRFNGNSGN